MKSKQVIALMMAAALTVTGSGVTTMAGQVSAGNEAVVIESDSVLKMLYETEGAEGLFTTLTADSVDPSGFHYGEEVAVTATLTKAEGAIFRAGGEPVLEIVAGESENDEDATAVSETVKAVFKGDTATHTLRFKPEKGKKYYVRASAVKSTDSASTKTFKCSDEITLEAAREDLKSSDIPSPDFSKKVVFKASDETLDYGNIKEDKLQPVIDEINKDPAVKGIGTWSLDDENNSGVDFTSNLTQTVKLEFDLGENKGSYNLTLGKDDSEVEEGVKFSRDVKVTAIKLVKKVEVKTKGGSATPADLLITSTEKNPSVILQAKLDDVEAKKDEVKWELVGNAGDYLEVSDNGNGQITVMSKGKVTPEGGVQVKATANQAEFAKLVEEEPASGTFTINVKKGIASSEALKSIEDVCNAEVKNFTYDGAEKWGAHYEALIAKLNDKNSNPLAAYGEYSLTEGETAVSTGEQELTFVYTLESKNTGLKSAEDKGWKGDAVEKKYKVTVAKAVKDASGLQKELGIKDAYPIGTTLEEILDKEKSPAKDTYNLEWVTKNAQGAWVTSVAAGESGLKKPIEKLGSFSDTYRLSVSLEESNNYTLSGADKEGKLILPLENVKIVVPDFTPVIVSGDDHVLGEKYTDESTIVLKVNPDDIKKELGVTAETGANQYYSLTFQWSKDGKILTDNHEDENVKENKITLDDEAGTLTIGSWTAEAAGSYTCKVTAVLNDAGKKLAALNGVHDSISKTTSAVKVEISSIKFGDPSPASVDNMVYGDEKTAGTISVKATVNGIDSYRIFYRELDEKGKEGAEVEVFAKTLEEIEKKKFKDGFDITYNLKDAKLPAGTYNFYVSVKAGTDVNTSKAIPVTVKAVEVKASGLSKEKLSAEALTYGQTLADVKLSYSGEEKDKLDFTLKDDLKTVLPAGEHTLKVAVAAKENYALDKETELSVTLTVKKAELKAAAQDLTITEGDKAAKLAVKVTGLASADKEEDVVKLTPYAEAAGKEVTDLSTLAAGSYKIRVKAEVTEKASANYEKEVKTEIGILTVNAKPAQKPEEQKPGTGTEQKPSTGTEQKPSTGTEQKPSTGTEQKPGTGTEQKPGTGTQKPSTSSKVTSKKVEITLNGQTLSGTVKAKVKKTYKLKASVTLSNGKKNSKVTWSSSNKKIATVSKSGVVKVLGRTGKVKITAKASDKKKSKTIILNVTKSNIKATKIAITGAKTMKVKKSQTLKATVSPATVTNAKVTWKSSNTKIATVSQKGKVTAKKKGTVKISATAKDGSRKRAVITIKVR